NSIIPITWVIRTRVEPYSLSKEIQDELRMASGGLPVAHIRSMEQVRGESTARTDFNMTLLMIFAGVALLLAAIGIYGLMAYSVQQRTQEIGIRIALGASAHDVRKMIVRQGMALALAGVFIGVAAALGLTRLMASLLYGVTARDPIAMTSVALLLIGVALAATYIPARRASRVDQIALGASAHDVRKMIVRQGMALALAGVFIGVAAALGLTRLMASLLYGVTARDPIAMTSVALLLIGVALAATYIPARRASRVD